MDGKKIFFVLTILIFTGLHTSFVQADGNHNSQSTISNAIKGFQRNEQQDSTNNPPNQLVEDSHSEMNHDLMEEEQDSNPINNDIDADMGHEGTSEIEETTHTNDHSLETGEDLTGHDNSSHEEEVTSVEEVAPNYKILGTFGALNFTFIGIGAVLKVRKGKEKKDEAQK